MSLERLFSKMNLIKTTLRNHLTNNSLNSISYILVLVDCHYKVFMMNIVHCLSQRKRKLYNKHKSKKTKRPHFNISDISSESKSSTDSSASEDKIIIKFYSITFENVTKFSFIDSLTKFIFMSEMNYDCKINVNNLVSFSFNVNVQCNKKTNFTSF